MGGLMNFLSPALTTATQAAGANIQGKEQGSALMRQIMGQEAALAKTRAETEKTFADTNLANRHAGVPMLGDAGYNAAKAGESGAVEEGKTPGLVRREQLMAPIKTDQAINTARGVEPIHTEGAVNTARRIEPFKTQGAINTAKGVAPIKVQEAIDIASGTEPLKAKSAADAYASKPSDQIRTICRGGHRQNW